MIRKIADTILNSFGFKTDRKIVVICSDDWGSIRNKDQRSRQRLIADGIDVNSNRFDQFDCLESNEDLTALYSVLEKYKDCRGNRPVITALTNVANPDFRKIKESRFEQYFFQSSDQTFKSHPGRDRVLDLYKEGIANRIFIPQFHGREHLQIVPWLQALRSGDRKTTLAFDQEFFFLSRSDVAMHELAGEYAEAFNFWNRADVSTHKEIVTSGVRLFRDLFGYKAGFFTSPVLIHHPELNETLASAGVSVIDSPRIRKEPTGKNNLRKKFCYTGQRNSFGQTYVNRNAVFEPNLAGNGVDSCLAQVERMFTFRKPVIISNHRVNFVAGINEKNRTEGLSQLDTLLKTLIHRWPTIEFMDVMELKKVIDDAR